MGKRGPLSKAEEGALRAAPLDYRGSRDRAYLRQGLRGLREALTDWFRHVEKAARDGLYIPCAERADCVVALLCDFEALDMMGLASETRRRDEGGARVHKSRRAPQRSLRCVKPPGKATELPGIVR